MENFTPLSALLGGVLIGLAAVLLLWANGRIAGISGIVGGLLPPKASDAGWRLAFVAGLVAGPYLHAALAGGVAPITVSSSAGLLLAAGLLVGFGSRLGAGCTSGHGVCGLARLSPRSFAATGTFLVAALVTMSVTRRVIRG